MQNISPELLRKYFSGKCTADEKAQVEYWLNRDDDPIADDKEIFSGIDRKTLRDRIWHRIKPNDVREKVPIRYSTFLKVAASLLVILSASWLVYQYRSVPVSNKLPMVSEYNIVSAGRGEKVKLTLADGTTIHLNADSELVVPPQFTDTARTIRLTGEAYLEVTKDATRPFTVITPSTTVRVLGTVFNVRAYADETYTTVAVEEGKVQVTASNGHSVLVTRNQMARYTLPDKALSTQEINMEIYSAWRDGKLVFRDQSLKEIATTLERWYDVQIEIKNEVIADHRFTGSFSNSPSLASLIKDISVVMQFNYDLNKKNLIIY